MRLAFACLLVACETSAPLPHGSSAASCGTCHESQLNGLQHSAHSRGTSSPVFSALLPRVERAWGSAARERCVACHAPAHDEESSVTCISCHGAVGNREERNGSLVLDLDAPLASRSRELSLDAHRVAPRRFLTSSSLCGTCHEVHGPGRFAEHTLTEFQASAGDETCLTCHSATGHTFAGVEPAWGKPETERRRADDAAKALWANALTLSAEWSDGHALITLANPGRHSVPTGVSMLRDVWVEVETNGVTTRVLEPRTRLINSSGVDVPLITDADHVHEGALAAKSSRSVKWTPPEGTKSLRVRLRAKAVRDDVMHALELDALAREVATHDVLERTLTIP